MFGLTQDSVRRTAPFQKVRARHRCDGLYSVPTGTFTVFPGCAGLLIGFAATLLDEEIVG
jgi:hypothetical protein